MCATRRLYHVEGEIADLVCVGMSDGISGSVVFPRESDVKASDGDGNAAFVRRTSASVHVHWKESVAIAHA